MTNKKPCLIIGAGGHAKVLIDALRSSGASFAGCLDINPKLWGQEIEGVKVLGGQELIRDFKPGSVELINGVGAIRSDIRVRQRVYHELKSAGHSFGVIQAATSVVSASARVGEGTQILTQAVVHPQAVVGENTVVNTAAIVEHDCVVGAHSFICPRAILCGGVTLEEGCFIGSGAILLPLVKLGAGAVIGAGTVVHKNVAAGTVVLGAAARSRLRPKPEPGSGLL